MSSDPADQPSSLSEPSSTAETEAQPTEAPGSELVQPEASATQPAEPVQPEAPGPEDSPAEGIVDSSNATAASATPLPPNDDPSAEPAEGEPKAEADSAASGPLSKIQIGSRRGDDKPQGSRPQMPTSKPVDVTLPPTGPVPVPSKRAPLSDELERELEEVLGDASLEQLIQEPMVDGVSESALEAESRVMGTVVKTHGDNVFMTLGGHNEGVASVRQFKEPPEAGQQIEVIVRGVSGEDGLFEVAVPGAAISVGDWGDIAEGAVVEARVTGSNTGGLECKVNNIRGFIPASQISIYRVENLNEFIDQKLVCVVTEANPQRKNLVLSRRAILEREREEARKKVLAELEVGQVREGVVRSIRDFGAFVDLGGVDGLIHISQLSWERVEHPKDVLSENESVQVRIEKIDPQTGKIGLSYRALQEHPWKGVTEKFSVGAVVTGAVSKIANFGAFVRLAPGIEGLVHVSELAHYRVSLVSSIVKEGDEVSVKVLSVDEENQRISLSIKQTTEAPKQQRGGKEEVVEEATAALPKHEGPLKGGVDKPSGGEKFGLKW